MGAVQLWKDVIRRVICTCCKLALAELSVDWTVLIFQTHKMDSSTDTQPVTLFNCN
jgi:hypothetical protein